MPNVKQLMENGAYTLKKRSALPSSSAINWALSLIHIYTYQNNEYKKFTQPKNAGDADLLGVELA